MRALVALLLGFASISPSLAGSLEDELVAIERALWKAWKNHDANVYVQSMTDDAVQISTGGETLKGRENITALVRSHECTLNSIDMSETDLRQPTPETAILTYMAKQDMTCRGEKSPAKILSTSFYVRRDGNWRWIHYQETAVD